MTLSGRSSATDKLVTDRIGSTWRPVYNSVSGMAVKDAIQADVTTGALAASRTQEWFGKNLSSMKKGLIENATRGVSTALRRVLKGDVPQHPPTAALGVHPVIPAEEVQTLLAEPDTALAQIIRARVMRRDIIKLNPIYAEDLPKLQECSDNSNKKIATSWPVSELPAH